MMDAREARDIAINARLGNQDSMLPKVLERIRESCTDGDFHCNFHTDGKHLSVGEINYLEGLGYRLSWNSACLWYEISWEVEE